LVGRLYKKMNIAIWSIKVFRSHSFISKRLDANVLEHPTLQAADVSDVDAEFIADPFILLHNSKYYIFFEVLDRATWKGVIGLAVSDDGEYWAYERIVLKENFHLSYPYVFWHRDEIYMIPETIGAGKIVLYKASKFPYVWEVARELIQGQYADPSVFQYNNKWWMYAFSSANGNLHLFYSDKLDGAWMEHPKSPLISQNFRITRPAGRVIVHNEDVYRFAQDGVPYYGKSVKSFKITKLSETEYEEHEVDVILNGSNHEADWRKDGMHHIDQLKTNDNEWLIAVDGHVFQKQYYLKWRLKRFLNNPGYDLRRIYNRYREKYPEV
jgi:hypothetical protein